MAPEGYGQGGVLERQLRGAHGELECDISSCRATLGLADGKSGHRASCEKCDGTEAAGC